MYEDSNLAPFEVIPVNEILIVKNKTIFQFDQYGNHLWFLDTDKEDLPEMGFGC